VGASFLEVHQHGQPLIVVAARLEACPNHDACRSGLHQKGTNCCDCHLHLSAHPFGPLPILLQQQQQQNEGISSRKGGPLDHQDCVRCGKENHVTAPHGQESQEGMKMQQ